MGDLVKGFERLSYVSPLSGDELRQRFGTRSPGEDIMGDEKSRTNDVVARRMAAGIKNTKEVWCGGNHEKGVGYMGEERVIGKLFSSWGQVE